MAKTIIQLVEGGNIIKKRGNARFTTWGRIVCEHCDSDDKGIHLCRHCGTNIPNKKTCKNQVGLCIDCF